MRKSTKRTCSVTGLKTNPENFYTNQTHVKAVDNLRRNTGATKQQLTRITKDNKYNKQKQLNYGKYY